MGWGSLGCALTNIKMPKIETLAALGDEMTSILKTILTTNLHNTSWKPTLTTYLDNQSWLTTLIDMPQVVPIVIPIVIYALDMPLICLWFSLRFDKILTDMNEWVSDSLTWIHDIPDIPLIYPWCTHDIPLIYPAYTLDMPLIYPWFTLDIAWWNARDLTKS